MPADRPPTFKQAMATVLAELTPQPWDFTTPEGTRLRVIPEGLTQGPGDGATLIQICEAAHVQVTPDGPEYTVRTSDMPGLLSALRTRSEWTHEGWGEVLAVRPEADGMRLAYTVWSRDTTGQPADVDRTVLVPEEQRLPLASALARAADVARGWEDVPTCAECDRPVNYPTATYCSTACRNRADRHDLPGVSGE